MFKVVTFNENCIIIKISFENIAKITIVALNVLNFQFESIVKNVFVNAIA